MVTLSSSDTEEALELLFLHADHDNVSRVSEPSSCSNSDLFKDMIWRRVFTLLSLWML
jgi:hypothetical protein